MYDHPLNQLRNTCPSHIACQVCQARLQSLGRTVAVLSTSEGANTIMPWLSCIPILDSAQ